MKSKVVYKKKILALVLVALAMSIIVGGTLAYYTVHSPYLENTFTFGKIEIELKETPREYVIVPGGTIEKDPKIIVKKGSEASWVFVKLEESERFSLFIEYELNGNWTQLKKPDNSDVTGVYYREESAAQTQDMSYEVLKDNQVKVASNVSKSKLEKLSKENTQLGLTITAYAIQKNGIQDAYSAWTKINDQLN